MRGILWHVTRKLEGIFDGILMEFHIRISEDKNQIQKLMYIPQFLSSSLYGSCFQNSIILPLFLFVKCDSAKKQFTLVMDRRKADTLFTHLLVAHTTSMLIGECHFPLWSSTACRNMKWLWMTSGYLKVTDFIVAPSFQSHRVFFPLS